MKCATQECFAPRAPGSCHCEGHKPVVDLAMLLDVDDFDAVMVAIERTIDGAESLSLDSPDDRYRLKKRLRMALGSVQ